MEEVQSLRKRFIIKTKLHDEQRAMVSRMIKKKNWLLVAKAGAGKSLCTISTFCYLYNNNKVDTLFVSMPKNAYDKAVWKEELRKHSNIPFIDIETLASKTGFNLSKIKQVVSQYPVILSKHTHVHVYSDLIKLIMSSTRCSLCLDEGHRFKNSNSRLTIAARLTFNRAYVRSMLTATPLSKDMKDCYNLINFIKPWFLGTFDNFKQEFCVVKQKVIGKTFTGALRKVDEIVGVISEQALQQRLYPIVISGSSHHELNFHYLNYEMDPFETSIYRRLATGLFTASDDETPEDWFHRVITQEQKPIDYSIKEVSRHSSRFLYLQFAADGLIQEDGTIGNRLGTKSKLILSCLKSIFQKGLSTVLFCEYYAQLDFMKKCLKRFFPNVRVLEASGKVALKEGSISEAAVKQKPHCILLSKAGSESSSFYFINNVVFFSIPTIPSAFIQTVGRINRVNTLFPGDLHVWIPQSDNVDKYKLLLVSKKTALSESVTNRESNVPDDFKEMAKGIEDMKLLKKYLLWHQDESDKLTL
jgi:superfamily II DNA or RNA helicase